MKDSGVATFPEPSEKPPCRLPWLAYCGAGAVPVGTVASGFSPVLRPWLVQGGRCVAHDGPLRLDRRGVHPVGPGGPAGTVPVASCASAADSSSAVDSVK